MDQADAARPRLAREYSRSAGNAMQPTVVGEGAWVRMNGWMADPGIRRLSFAECRGHIAAWSTDGAAATQAGAIPPVVGVLVNAWEEYTLRFKLLPYWSSVDKPLSSFF